MKRLFLFTVLLALCLQIEAAELYVRPGDYSSIQSAIIDSNDGDTVIVDPNIYYENINFLGRSITVRSSNPNDPNVVAATIIDGSSPDDPNIASVITFTNNEDANSVLTGFTIQNGLGQTDPTVDWRVWTGTNGDGGGILCTSASPTITKNIFRNCKANYGGGAIFCHNGASPTISENTFLNNYAGWYGGAIFARLYCSPTISNNIIQQNVCEYLGGGIYLAGWCDAKIISNLIKANECRSLAGGAIYYFTFSSPTIANNIISDNIAESGGSAIMVEGSAGLIINNTIIDNKITQPTTYSCALAIYSTPTLVNNLVLNNQGWGIYTGNQSNPIIFNNDIWNNSYGNYFGKIEDQTGLNGNLSINPLLGPELPEPLPSYELEPNSLCRNVGNNTYLPAWIQKDYDETSRIIDGIVDIGAQEFRAKAVPQDYPNIQTAINNANTDDEIIVSPGFYQENLNFSGKNLILRSLNPLDLNYVEQTIIDGNDQASCIILESGEDKSAVIAGFTIQNGNAKGPESNRVYGGGVYIADYAGATIIYNHIQNNKSNKYGGGIDTRHFTETVIENNLIEQNYSGFMGAGIHVGHDAFCRIYNNIIRNNTTASNRQGGGIYIYNHSTIEIISNEICYNETDNGGGIYGWAIAGKIQRNHIIGNHLGGGISLNQYAYDPCFVPNLIISNNIIEGNYALRYGGGIYVVQGPSKIINNTIVGNISIEGGGAGISAGYKATPLIQNNIIAQNQGIGIEAVLTSNPDLYSNPDVVANDIWGNQVTNYGGTLLDLTDVNDNISIDPCFVDSGFWSDNNTPADINDDYWVMGDYRIGYFSHCRDAADSNYAPSVDFYENPRPHFSGFDIGACELQIYDLTATGTVDYSDLSLVINDWLKQGPLIPVDLNKDEKVNFLDIALLATGWLE